MSQNSMNDLVDGMERLGKMSFDGLPDIAILQIMEQQDIISQFKMRLVNKRMNKLQPTVKNYLDEIAITIHSTNYELYVMPLKSPIRCDKFDILLHRLKPLTHNSRVNLITVKVDEGAEEQIRIVFDTLSDFNAGGLVVEALHADEFGLTTISLPQVNLSTLLKLAQNIIKISISCPCSSLTSNDLYTIRQNMLDGRFSLKYLDLDVAEEVEKSFENEYFGITIETNFPVGTRIVRTTDQTFELYVSGHPFRANLHHFEGDFRTEFGFGLICFEKCTADEKSDRKYKKFEMNRLYECTDDDVDNDE